MVAPDLSGVVLAAFRPRLSMEIRPVKRVRAGQFRAGTVLLVLGLVGAAGCSTPPTGTDRFEYRQVQLGVRARIVLYASSDAVARPIAQRAFARIEEIDEIASDYRVDSEVIRLAAAAGGDPVAVSDELYELLEASVELSMRTGGAFDVTIGPVSSLWRRAIRDGVPPSDADIAAARALVDWRAIELDPVDRRARLARPGMRLDLGSIAKGYAADAALAVIRQHGIASALVDLGGDIVVGAPPPGKLGWRVDVADRGVSLFLANEAVATSGGTEQYLETLSGGHSHIVDARTGIGIPSRDVITVRARSGMMADALASVVALVGRARGAEIVRRYRGGRLLSGGPAAGK